jgi:hypothetical protein
LFTYLGLHKGRIALDFREWQPAKSDIQRTSRAEMMLVLMMPVRRAIPPLLFSDFDQFSDRARHAAREIAAGDEATLAQRTECRFDTLAYLGYLLIIHPVFHVSVSFLG